MKTIKSFIVLAFAAVLTTALPSCTGPGTSCQKCIDQKPAPTPFSTQLNSINHYITWAQAVDMTSRYQTLSDSILAGHFKGNPQVLPIYETFNLKAVDSLICQPNVVGLRIYMAMDNQHKVRFVLTGVDTQGKDIIKGSSAPGGISILPEGGSGVIAEAGQRWP